MLRLPIVLLACLTGGAAGAIELEPLRATALGAQVELTWQLAAGSTATCLVLHTRDGVSWDTLGIASPESDTSEAQIFHFLHGQVDEGDQYYKIMYILSGRFISYSDAVHIRITKTASTILLHPNPSNGRTFVHLPEGYEGTITIHNSFGKCVLTVGARDLTDRMLNLETFGAGVYLVTAGENYDRLVVQ